MRYAVVSKDLTISQLQDEVKRAGAKNIRVALASKQVFCDLEPDAVSKLQAMGCSVTRIGGVRATVMPPIIAPPTPIAAVPTYRAADLILAIGLEDLRHLTEPPLYGEGMNLAIIGTGIRKTHKRINGRVIYEKNYTSDVMQDGYDHDTGVCDIVLSIAPECNIINMKALDSKGQGTDEDVAIAIDDCISLHDTNSDIAPSVINLSLGGPDDGNPDNPLRVACRAAIDRGIWVIASVGNNGPAPYSVTCPACEKYVIAVGSASYEPFQVSDFSSRGPTMEGLIKPDSVLFGENIEMASSASDTAMTAKSGTSFAAPFASGMVVLFHEALQRRITPTVPITGVYPELGIWGIREFPPELFIDKFLVGICVKPEDAPRGKDPEYGYGLPFGPLIYKAVTAVPVMETVMATIPPLLGIAMMGMMMIPMVKVLRSTTPS